MHRLQIQHVDLLVSSEIKGELTRGDYRIMIEVAGGATLSLVYHDLLKTALPHLNERSKVVLIVCGGSISTFVG